MNARPIRILVADDEEDLVAVLSMRLEGTGLFEVAKAYDGEEAVALARRFHPELVLIDKIMPRMDGWEACRRMRAEPGTREAGIVLMSAELAAASEEKAMEAGADLFVPKPYDDEALVGLLQAVAADRRTRPSS